MALSTIIRATPTQIPMLWEAIKYAVANADELGTDAIGPYCQWLLQALLSERAQCWVSLNEERLLLSLMVTMIFRNQFTGEKELTAHGLYAFQGFTENTMDQGFALLRDFASASGCAVITCVSRHARMWEIFQTHGWTEQHRTFQLTAA